LQGNVIAGSSFVDESMLTGESLPVAKEIGRPVFSGTVNWVRYIIVFCESLVLFIFILISIAWWQPIVI
jgi:cation transport ATPase